MDGSSNRRRPGLRVWLPLAVGLIVGVGVFAAIGLGRDGEDSAPVAAEQPTPDTITAGRTVFARVGCASCHSLAAANASAQIGPDLDEQLELHTRESLRAKILDPYPGEGEGFGIMPEDYGQRLSDRELDALLDFLVAATRRDS